MKRNCWEMSRSLGTRFHLFRVVKMVIIVNFLFSFEFGRKNVVIKNSLVLFVLDFALFLLNCSHLGGMKLHKKDIVQTCVSLYLSFLNSLMCSPFFSIASDYINFTL